VSESPEAHEAPKFMRASEPDPAHWWGQRLPSVAILGLVLASTAVAILVMANTATKVLPEVGKDRLGADNWTDPIGLELANGFHVGRVPDCAAGAFTRFVLWNADSEPYWEVVGPATPLNTFLVGVAPEGFTTLTPFEDPPRGEVLRLVAFRRDGGAVGIRYEASELREARVVSGNPLVPYTIDGFQDAEVCSSGSRSADGEGSGADGVGGSVDGASGDEPDDEDDDGSPITITPGLGSGGGTTTTIDDGTDPGDG
jgi:hypothetical protein